MNTFWIVMLVVGVTVALILVGGKLIVMNKQISALEQRPYSVTVTTPDGTPALPAKTVPLTLFPIGKDYIIMSVVSEHTDWLLEQINANGSVNRIYENEVLNECQFQVYLSDRVGQDDWDALFALPEKLKEIICQE